MVEDPLHVYLDVLEMPASKTIAEIFMRATGHKQITDAYLLDLAHRNNATFVTFDHRLKSMAGAHVRTELLGV